MRCPRVLYSRSLGAASAQMVVRLAQVVVRLAHRNDLFRDIPDASENEMTLRKQPVLLPFHALRALIAKFQKVQLANLVGFEKCCKTRIHFQRSVPT